MLQPPRLSRRSNRCDWREGGRATLDQDNTDSPAGSHPLPRHTNKTLQAYCRPPSLAISRFSSGFPYSPLCPPPACIRPSMSNATHLPHGIRLPGRLIQTNKTLQAYYCRSPSLAISRPPLAHRTTPAPLPYQTIPVPSNSCLPFFSSGWFGLV